MTAGFDHGAAAERFRPSAIRALFLAESPPACLPDGRWSYFFLEDDPGSEVLFATVMEALYACDYRKRSGQKPSLLRRFQADGFWLADAVEHPINRIDGRSTSTRERAKLIHANTPALISRLTDLRLAGVLPPAAGLVLLKRLVFETLAHSLTAAGFRVLHTVPIGFPGYHKDRRTVTGIREALAAGGLPSAISER